MFSFQDHEKKGGVTACVYVVGGGGVLTVDCLISIHARTIEEIYA